MKIRIDCYEERNKEIFDLRNSGKTYAYIAKVFNLTGERIRQIINNVFRKLISKNSKRSNKQEFLDKIRDNQINCMDWFDIYCNLRLAGIDTFIAEHCVVKFSNEDCILLLVDTDPEYSGSNDTVNYWYSGKLGNSLRKYFDKSIRIEFELGEIQGVKTPNMIMTEKLKKLKEEQSAMLKDKKSSNVT